MAKSLPSSVSLRAGLRAAGKMDRWPILLKLQPGYPPHEVRMHCVENAAWQKLRLSLKGLDTCDKLEQLLLWWNGQTSRANILALSEDTVEQLRGNALHYATEVQVGNYLGALRRGGQLDDDNLIRKAR